MRSELSKQFDSNYENEIKELKEQIQALKEAGALKMLGAYEKRLNKLLKLTSNKVS